MAKKNIEKELAKLTKRTITKEELRLDEYDIAGSLDSLVEMLQPYKGQNCLIEDNSNYYGDNCSPEFIVRSYREETDTEFEARKAEARLNLEVHNKNEEEYQKKRKDNDLAELARLKKKYEKGTK